MQFSADHLDVLDEEVLVDALDDVGVFDLHADVVPDHKRCKGMGGAWRDDHPDNIQATHWWCNGEKGSTRMDD